MPSTGTLSGCTAAVWLLVSGTAAADTPVRTVQLLCGAPLQQPLCNALSRHLQERFPAASVTAGSTAQDKADLTLRYIARHQSADWISGHLTWEHRDGRQGQSPVIEHSVMDGRLSGGSLSDFAGQLLRHTEFPL